MPGREPGGRTVVVPLHCECCSIHCVCVCSLGIAAEIHTDCCVYLLASWFMVGGVLLLANSAESSMMSL